MHVSNTRIWITCNNTYGLIIYVVKHIHTQWYIKLISININSNNNVLFTNSMVWGHNPNKLPLALTTNSKLHLRPKLSRWHSKTFDGKALVTDLQDCSWWQSWRQSHHPAELYLEWDDTSARCAFPSRGFMAPWTVPLAYYYHNKV